MSNFHLNRPKGLFLRFAYHLITLSSFNLLLIVLILFVPLIAGAKDGCGKSDKACMVSKEDVVSQEEGIFLGGSADIPVVLPHRVVDSTSSVVSGTGLSVSTAIGMTGVLATTHLKLEKSKPAELSSDFNKKNLPGRSGLPNHTMVSHWDGSLEGVPGIDKMFILLGGVLLVLIILVYLRHRFYSQKE